jgi:predicted PurR-regulated permease PerM
MVCAVTPDQTADDTSGHDDADAPPSTEATSPFESAADRILRIGKVSWAVVGILAAVGAVVWVLWHFAVILPPLIIAGALVFLLNPIVSFLQRRGLPRVIGTAVAYLGVLLGLTLVVLLVSPMITRQVDELSQSWDCHEEADSTTTTTTGDSESPRSDRTSSATSSTASTTTTMDVSDTSDRDGDTSRNGESGSGSSDDDEECLRTQLEQTADDWLAKSPLDLTVQEIVDEAQNSEVSVGDQLQTAREIGSRVVDVLLIMVLAPIFAFYFLIDLPRLRLVALELLPAPMDRDIVYMARHVGAAVGGFFRGQLFVALVVGIMSSLGLWLIGLDLWLVVGMIAGLFNMIPLIGPWIGGIPGLAIALTTGTPVQALLVIVVMVVVQQLDNHIISPYVMHRTVHLHPVAVMVALLLGGTLAGFFGLLIAVPATATLKIIGGHLWRRVVLGQDPVWDEEKAEMAKHDAEMGVDITGEPVGAAAKTADWGIPPLRRPGGITRSKPDKPGSGQAGSDSKS